MEQGKSTAEMDRYDAAAKTYATGRLDYTPKMFEETVKAARLGPETNVLDLGCGPGTIANTIAEYTGHVIAVDPSAGMIEEARASGHENVEYLQGSSEDLSFIDRPLALVTFGRSFHWMNQKETLRTLDSHVIPGGVLGFFYVGVFRPKNLPEHKWWFAIRRMANRLGDGSPQELRPPQPATSNIEPVLLRSPFSEIAIHSYITAFEWNIDKIEAWILSHYITGSGNKRKSSAEIRESIEKTLDPFGTGPWITHTEHKLLLASRPDGHVKEPDPR